MKIVMLLDNPLVNDPRVQREALSLKEAGHELSIYCLQRTGLAIKEVWQGISVNRLFSGGIFDIKKPAYLKKKAEYILEKENAIDVIHAHDYTMLHLGALIKKQRPDITLIYDSHELFHSFPLLNHTPSNNPWLYLKSYVVQKVRLKRERKDAQHADYLITVSDSIAEDLKNHFGLKQELLVIRNIPAYQQLSGKSSRLRSAFNIPGSQTLVIFIAGNIYSRGQNLKQALDELGNKAGVALVVIGNGSGRELHEAYCRQNDYTNLFFHDRVAPDEMISYLAEGDVALLPFWNRHDLSYWYALPNKLFEYIMAEIPILATVQPEYKKVIQGYGLGVCVMPEEEGAFSRGLDELIARMEEYPKKLTEAKKVLNWERERLKLIALYESIAAKRKGT